MSSAVNSPASRTCYCRQGAVHREEQEHVPQSDYHALLETEENSNTMDLDQIHETKVRYWSDYNRVFFDPKSLQPVPDASETVEGDWTTSHDLFRRYDEARILRYSLFLCLYFTQNTELMEGPLRLLIEECDNFQVLFSTLVPCFDMDSMHTHHRVYK